jgi:CBS domain-containing protein
MQVKELMKTNIIKIKNGTNLKKTAKILADNKISGAPVVDGEGRLIGIVSEKDIFRALYPDYADFYMDTGLRVDFGKIEDRILEISKLKAEDVMIRDIISVTPDTSIVKIGAIMLARNIHRVVVLKENKPQGIVTRRDIYRAIFKEKMKLDLLTL